MTKTNAERVLDYLWSVSPEGATNAQIRESTGIQSHQQVYMLTQDLLGRRLIESRRQGRAPHKPILLLSGELRITQNVPGHLLTLESRPIIGPAEKALWPYGEALDWHRQHVFRRE